MLTRLRVSGFKNLVDVDVRFGPFTCIAGPNAVGKSNLFDSVLFLSALADHPLMAAAQSVRGDENGARMSDIRSLFHRCGDEYIPEMSFETAMIVPSEGEDDLGDKAKASITFLRYSLRLGYKKDENPGSTGSLEVLHEDLNYIKVGDAAKHLLFPHSSEWRKTAIHGRRSGKQFISTEGTGEKTISKLHQDGGIRGKPLSTRQARNLPRTVLCAANTAESSTALLARREMQSWRLLQLEPSAMRRPDEFSAPTKLGSDGSNLAASLYRLAYQNGSRAKDTGNPNVCARVANRLAQLIDDVRTVSIDRDEKRERLTLNVMGADRTPHAARSLSDGTLRFLALAVLEQDPEFQGALCLEEPENGIHPARIPAMIRLLQDIATNVYEPVGRDNPLRQVIVNTHSPAVVQQVPDYALLVAQPAEMIHSDMRFAGVRFCCLPDTWRAKSPEAHVCKMGDLLAYLNPVIRHEGDTDEAATSNKPRNGRTTKTKRVIDRPDVAPYFPGWEPV
jgi:predicted ATPase